MNRLGQRTTSASVANVQARCHDPGRPGTVAPACPLHPRPVAPAAQRSGRRHAPARRHQGRPRSRAMAAIRIISAPAACMGQFIRERALGSRPMRRRQPNTLAMLPVSSAAETVSSDQPQKPPVSIAVAASAAYRLALAWHDPSARGHRVRLHSVANPQNDSLASLAFCRVRCLGRIGWHKPGSARKGDCRDHQAVVPPQSSAHRQRMPPQSRFPAS